MRGAIAVVGALLLLAGCGASGTLSARQSVERAQERTAAFGTFRFSVAGGAQGATFAGTGAVDARAGRSHLSVEAGAHGEAELIVDGSILYARLGGERWLSADLRGLGSLLSGRLVELTELAEQGPKSLLDRLRSVGEVEELGEEQVRGVQTTRYRATVEERGERATVLDAWVDGDGLVRRLRAAELTVELYDFGAEVRVVPPPASRVVDVAELLGGGA
ncbi:MAG: hypothetical protein ICV67_08355 [Thermoleophilia bacterium]|nr:hypothetical protein [Thermoleophilia bacterium]